MPADTTSGIAGDKNSLILNGVATAGATIALFDGAALLGAATVDDDGQWTFKTDKLKSGLHAFTARVSDTNGALAASAAFTVSLTADGGFVGVAKASPMSVAQPDLASALTSQDSANSVTGSAVISTGALTIGDGAAVEIHGASGQSVTFTGSTGTLKLDYSLGYTGQVSGLNGADAIDFADIQYSASTKATFLGDTVGGTLTVTDGTSTATINLQGNYLSSTWTLSDDGSGGTMVVDPVANSDWQTLKVGAGGLLSGLDISNDGTMVVRTDTYGAYVWDGAQWQQVVTATSMPAAFVHPGFSAGVYDIQIAPSNSNILYMMFDDYVFKSTNKGTTWTQTSLATFAENPNTSVRGDSGHMAIDPNNPNVVFVGTPQNGMWLTSDGGNTWQQVSGIPASLTNGQGEYPGITGLTFDPAIGGTTNGKTNTIFASSYGNGVYESTNGGVTWTHLSGGPINVNNATVSSNGTYYAVGNDNTSAWAFANGTWTQFSANTGGAPIAGVTVNPANPLQIVISGFGGNLDWSLDGGQTWSGWDPYNQLSSTDIPWLAGAGTYLGANNIQFSPTVPNELIVNGGTGVWTSTFTAEVVTLPYPTFTPVAWTDQSAGIEQLVAMDILVPPGGNPIVASWDRAFFSISNESTYPSTYGPVNGSFVAGWSLDYASSNPTFVVGIADWWGGVEQSGYSTNGGQTWTPFATELPGGGTNYIGGTIAASTPNNIIWSPAGGLAPFYTLNGGATWTQISLPGVSNWSTFDWAYAFDTRTVTADRVLTNTFYLYDADQGGAQAGVFKTTNGGQTWTKVFSGQIVNYSFYNGELESVPGQAGNLFFTGGIQGDGSTNQTWASFMRSTDGGSTWTAVPNVTEVFCYGFGAAAPGANYPSIYIAGWVNNVYGIWQSNDNAQSWIQIGTYPLGSLDYIKTISGDPDVYGQVYVGFNGSGYAYLPAASVNGSAPSITSFSPDSGVAGDHITDASTLTLAGTAVANSTVNVYDGATRLGSATADANGAWSFTTAALTSGNHSFTATDTVGSTTSGASSAFSVTIDTTAPNAPSIASFSPDSGVVGDHITNVNTVTLTGTAEANATVKVYDGATLLGSAAANGSGAWTYATAALSSGAHNLTATATDAAGNVSSASAAMAVTIDTTAPAAPSIVSFSPDSGVVGDHITNVNTLTLTGTAEANSTVKVYDGATLLGSATANGTGAWTYTTAALSNGAHSLTATATDVAGNIGSASSAFAVTIDTTAPAAPAIASFSTDSGVVGDGITNDNTLTLAGTAEANATVKVYDGATLLGSASANGSGVWTYTTAALSNGAHNLTATATDAAGNVGSASSVMAVTIDTTAPVAPTIASFSTDSGVVGDGITNDNTLTLTGSAEANSTVKVYDGATLLGSATANGSGAWTYTTAALSNGAHSLTTTATDAAGNVGSASSVMAVTVDTTAPTAPSITSFSPDSGVVGDHITNVSAVTITGAAEANSTVNVYDGATLLGSATTNGSGAWTYTTAALSSGAHNLTATATDAAGNLSSASSAFAVTIDTTAPTVTQTTASPSSGIKFPGDMVVVTVTFSEAVTVSGAPTLALNDGGTATYSGGSGTNSLTFSYTVSASDSNVAALAVTAVNLPGGANVRDAAANSANLAGALVTFAGLQIDPPTGAPTITSFSPDSGVVGDHITNASTVTLAGAAAANSTLNVYDGATLLGTASANGSGVWNFTTAALAAGSHSFTATDTVAGITSAASAAMAVTIDTTAPVAPSILSFSPDSGVLGDHITNVGAVTLTGTAEANATVKVYDGATLLGSATANGSGAWSYLTSALSNGPHSLTATATDAAGNVSSASSAYAVTIDTTAPTAPIIASFSPDSGVAGDHITNVNAVTLTGTAEANSTIKVYDGATLLGSATANGSGAWTYATAPLSGGTHNLTATATDAAGNVSVASTGFAVTIDTTAPVAPNITSFSADSGVVGDHITNDNTLTVSGTAEVNSTVNIYDGATLLGNATANGSGAWSYVTGALSSGNHNLTATATDAAGNVSSASSAFAVTIDTTAPNAPSIISFSPDSGVVGDQLTNTGTITLTGTAEANSTVKVYDGATLLGSATANGSGAWSYVTAALSNGAHSLTATATDAAGNVSSASSALALTIDTVAPTAPSITSFSPDSGVVGDHITNANTLMLTGTAEANSTVKVYDGATLLGSATANGSGAWTYTTVALSGGAHNLTATATDAAGNVSASSSAFAVTVDTTAPVAPSIVSFSPDSGVAGDGITNASTLTVGGTAEANSTVKVYDGATLLGSATANGTGVWTYTTAALSSGAHSFTATATDAAGNVSTTSAAMAITIDTTAPATPSILSFSPDSGVVGDGITNAGTVTLTGTAEANSTVKVYDGATLLGSATANGAGAWSYSTSALGNGTHNLTATATDAAGNASAASNALALTIDKAVPTAPNIVSFSTDTGVAGDGITSDNTPMLTGTAKANATVKIYDGATLLGTTTANGSGAWTYTTAALADGGHSLTATATDVAGNISGASSALNLTVDTVAPNPVITTTLLSLKGYVIMTGTSEPNSTISVYNADSGVLLGTALTAANGTWTFLRLGIGASNFAVTATDLAGNSSQLSNPITPPAPSALSFSPDSGVVGDAITNTGTLALAGSAVANSTVSVYDGATLLGTTTANGSGAWNFTTAALASGTHSFTATDTISGVTSVASAALAVTIDTTAPAVPSIASFSPDSGVAGDHITNVNTVTLTGAAEANAIVKVYDGATFLGSATADGSGAWSYTTAALSNGAHSVTVTATDVAGNVSAASSTFAVTIDTAAPVAPSITSFSPDSGVVGDRITNVSVLTLTGTAEANATVKVYDGATLLGSAVANGAGAWSYSTTALSSGAHNLTATASDVAGNVSAASSAFAVTIDTTAPAAPSITSFSPDSAIAGDGITNVSVLTLTGTAEANSTVKIYDGATLLGGATANGAGAWSYVTGALSNGVHSLTATAMDVAGNVGAASSATSVTVDTTAPLAPSIVSFTPDSGITGDHITNNGALTLNGTAEANGTIKIYDGATLLGSATANGSGAWNYVTAALGNGTHNLTATATDVAGNVSATSSAFTATIDTIAPTVTQTVAVPATGLQFPGDTITLTVTLSEAVTVSGTPTLALNDGGTATYTGGSGSNTLTFTYTIGASDSDVAALAVTAVNLPGGATVQDVAGNNAILAGALITFAGLAIDPPAGVPNIISFSPDSAVLGDGITNANVLTLNGVAVAGSTVNVYDGATLLGTAVASGIGVWSFATAALASGAHSFTATDTVAGLTSAASAALNVTIDTSAPTAPSIVSFSPDSGVVGDGITNTGTVTLAGAAEANATVKVYDGSTLLGSVTANGSGAWTYTTAVMGNGAHNLTATATDAAGNVSAASSAVALIVDTVAPAAPSIVSFSPDSGTVGDHLTNTGTVTLTGAAEANATVKVYDGVTLLGSVTANGSGAWSYMTGALSNGAHNLTATATDAAGNVSSASAAMAIAIDTVVPGTPTIATMSPDTGLAGDGITSANVLTLTGAAEANSTVKIFDGATLIGSVTANGSGAWSYATGALSNGAHNFTVTATDAAGNVSATSGAIAATVDTVAPTAPSIVSFSPDSGTVGDHITNTGTLTFAGTAEANSTIKLYDGATLLGSVTANGSGAWSYAVSGLANGTHNLTATATDVAGNISVASSVFAATIDTIAPVVTASLASDTGASATDNITSNATLTGFADANAVVHFTVDGNAIAGTATADAGGHWSFTPAGLSDGAHTIIANDTDAAGNVGTASISFTLDKAAPVAPSVASFTPDTDTIGDGLTGANVLTLTGTAEANATVKVFDGVTLLGSVTANGNGAWSFGTGTLANGTHGFTATATDAAGNASGASSSLDVTVDYTQPPIALLDPNLILSPKGIGLLAGNSQAGSTISVVDDSSGASLGQTAVTAGGAWSLLVALSNTVHTLTESATDQSGNTGTLNLVVGTMGNDTFTSTAANQIFLGRGGNDTFVFSGNFGKDTIFDFQAGDVLQLDHNTFANYSNVLAHSAQVGADVVIAADALHSITLHNTALSQLSADVFHIV